MSAMPQGRSSYDALSRPRPPILTPPDEKAAGRPGPASGRDFLSAHRRFARAAVWIYVGAAAITVILLVVALVTDLAYEEAVIRSTLLRETELRAHHFSWYLGVLENELRRLGLRSEVNLLDQNMEPERSLLELSHNKSTFFDVGVAILGADGTVAWSEPRSFLPPGQSMANERWFQTVRDSTTVRIEPVQPERETDSLIYVVSPVVRGGRFTAVLLGAIDLAHQAPLGSAAQSDARVDTVLATRDGAIVYPPKPPPFAAEAAWHRMLTGRASGSFLADAQLGGRGVVAAASPVQGASFLLLSIADEQRLFAPARRRLLERLSLALIVTALPFFFLVQMLRRSLQAFRRAEAEARTEEQLKRLGEAANVIAHEISNSLNGLTVGLDLMAPDGGPESRKRQVTLGALRSEVQRLADFTRELLIFSKGISPRPVTLELGRFVHTVVDLARERAADQGVRLDVDDGHRPVTVRADPKLLHVVIVNLVGNALDAVAMCDGLSPHVTVAVAADGAGAQVRVSDNGPGVAKSVGPRLFEPFVSGKPNGVGIGLALSRKIARAHGGELELEAVGRDTTFLLTLPREEP